jgi:hypothetical protein
VISIARRARRWLVPALALVVLLGAFAGVAASSGETTSAAPSSRGPAHATGFLDHLADELGVSRDELLAAAARAGESTLDDLQDNGLLTAAQAELARDALRQAVTNPSALKASLHRWAGRLAPYRTVAVRVRHSVASSLARLLGVGQRELRELFVRSELSTAAAKAGVSRSELAAATRRAARGALAPAVDRGLVTRTQASLLIHHTVAAVDHHW